MYRHISKLVALMFFVAPTVAHAEYCWNERVTQVIVFGNNVFFTTNKSCPQWCGLTAGLSSDAYNRFYSILLTSFTTGKLVTTYWSQTAAGSNCPVVALYAAPDLISIN